MATKFVLNETSYFGKGAREELAGEIQKRGFKKVFLVSDKSLVEGKEEIEGKNYNYEEYTGITNFAIKLTDENNSENVKTRFYFDGNDLVYIKTIVGDSQELLRVEISNDVDSNLFEIPNDYVSR